MKVNVCILYAHNLNEPHKSYATGLTAKDFKGNVQWSIRDAKVIKYINPKGEESIVTKPRVISMYD